MSISVKKNVKPDVAPPGGSAPPPTPLGKWGVPQEAYDIGILNAEYHERLLMDLDNLAGVAGIPKRFVWSRMSNHCTVEELSWVKKIRSNTECGIVYTGNTTDAPIEDRMMAIAGACLRNYIDARVMSVQQVLSLMKSDNLPEPTVLLIPNFFLGTGAGPVGVARSGSEMAAWQVSNLLGLLYARLAAGHKTVVYVASLPALSKEFGASFMQHLTTHYKQIVV